MKNSSQPSPTPDRRACEAAAWVLRCDRGLTAAEQDAYSAWLAGDPQHGAEVARYRRHWHRLDSLAAWLPEHSARPNPDLLAPPMSRRLLRATLLFVPLAAAAGVVMTILFRPTAATVLAPANPVAAMSGVESSNQRVLPDGSVIELNRGADVAVEFTATERRVVLRRGEAHFAVAKEPARPFIVRAQDVVVRAVGTSFNVRLDARVVEVLVTAGQVRVSPPGTGGTGRAGPAAPAPDLEPAAAETPEAPILSARQRAVISLAPESPLPQIATLTSGEIERVLAWQHRLLDFTAAPLTDIVAEFNRRNAVQLVVVDPELASIRISAAFRSDNLDGFVRLLEAGFNARAERRGEAEIVLRRAR